MAELNPSTEPAEQTASAPQVEAPHHTDGASATHTTAEKKHSIKEALKPQARRTSVVEDYAAELDEMASLTRALNKKDDETSQAWKKGYPYDTKLSPVVLPALHQAPALRRRNRLDGPLLVQSCRR